MLQGEKSKREKAFRFRSLTEGMLWVRVVLSVWFRDYFGFQDTLDKPWSPVASCLGLDQAELRCSSSSSSKSFLICNTGDLLKCGLLNWPYGEKKNGWDLLSPSMFSKHHSLPLLLIEHWLPHWRSWACGVQLDNHLQIGLRCNFVVLPWI